MIVSSLSFASALAFLTTDPQIPPNFYPGLVSAREASKNTQKEMIIFFSNKTCTTCEGAWAAFSKDAKATEQYVSTRMDVGDFDGGIFFDLLDLQEVPSWIILFPDGTEKERWEGGWKDETGKPTKYDMSVMQTTAKEEKKTNTTPKPSTTTVITSKQNNTPKEFTDPPAHGFFIQAGYFGSEANAQKMLGELRSKGITGYEIKSIQQNGGTFYRVMSEIYSLESDATKEQQRLAGVGIKSNIKEI